ncbi:MAG TPA: hypothetical protein VGA96_18285 [Fibrella sp.]|jgi:hypothetical protein
MILFLTTLDRQANQREFNCRLTSMEANFDFLSSIVAQGNTLLTAYLVDENSRMDLPVAAFDGLPLSVGIDALQQEWQAILSQPDPFTLAHREGIIQLTRQRIDQLQRAIKTHERMAGWYSQWLQRTQEWTTVPESTRSRLIERYEAQLALHKFQLAKAHFQATLAVNRLNQLLKRD